ncbi:MAG TPA: 2-oxoacid:acceptor oxidoreductase family protein [Thermosynergistes sp.]|nr:2-oxoacid:acceptor oxidoreductase family protein [Thermosynergistes sp.]
MKLGNRICANMVMLGYFQEATGLITRDDVVETMKELVPERFHELNERAIDAGVELAKGTQIDIF